MINNTHPFETETMQGRDITDHPMLEWKERPYGWSIIDSDPISKDETPSEVHERYASLLRKMIGMTVVAVEESHSEDERGKHRLIRLKLEPAYTTQEGIKKARWNWWEWLRKLHAGEVTTENNYLQHYTETK